MTSLRSLTVLNNSLLEVDLLYVSNDAAAAAEEEEERSFVHIPPGEARTQQTFAEHKWRCRSRPDGTLLVTVACGEANLFVTDLSPERGEPRRLELDNHTQAEGQRRCGLMARAARSQATSTRLPASPARSKPSRGTRGASSRPPMPRSSRRSCLAPPALASAWEACRQRRAC